jgi:hypothetical protein
MPRSAFSLALVSMFSFSSIAQAGALNPWYGRLGDGDAAVTPYVYVMNDGAVDASVYVQSSFAKHFDLLVGAGGAMVPGAQGGFTKVDLMPRVFLTDTLGATVRTIVSADGSTTVAPEFHGVFARGSFTLATNIGYGGQTAYGLFAPEYALSERVSVYVEVDPVLPMDGEASLTTVPGVSLILDRNARHSCALGVQIPTLTPEAPSYGLWYSTSLGGRDRDSDRFADSSGVGEQSGG